MRYADNLFVSNPGDKEHILYAPKVDKEGNIELVEAGREDIREKINSYAESTDISIILSRVAQGDLSGLQVNPGMYGDFTEMPKTYADFLQLEIDSNNLFMKLPLDVRAQFDYDPQKFFAQAGTEDWQKKLGDVLPVEYRWKDPNVVPEQSEEKVTE